MSKVDEYLAALEYCLVNASRAGLEEIRQIWLTMAESYRYLALPEREDAKNGNMYNTGSSLETVAERSSAPADGYGGAPYSASANRRSYS
jgi:hypothetical protein